MMGQGTSTEFLLVIDEIQKINNWTETVKQLWDSDSRERRDLKVILLGSSRLLL
jgi:predicted AAA+ superfamily ATPase